MNLVCFGSGLVVELQLAVDKSNNFDKSRDATKAIMQLISKGKIDTTHLITHRYPLSRIKDAYTLFANRSDGVIKTSIYPD